MTKMAQKQVRLGFERDCVEVPLDQIYCPIPLPGGIKESVMYLQIRSSVQVIGLVEPVVVALNREQTGTFIVLDGRMRLEALRDLGAQRVLCLISTEDEGYTYNKRVNRLSVVQAHRMIVRAAERGVSVQQLAEALNVSPGAIREKFRLLDGICTEAVALLADKPATYGMFRSQADEALSPDRRGTGHGQSWQLLHQAGNRDAANDPRRSVDRRSDLQGTARGAN